MRTALAVAGIALLSVTVRAGEARPDPKGVEFFEKKIRPVLVEHCYKCHSAESKKSRGGLSVDSRAGLLTGGDSGPALVPGEPTKSLLLQAIRHDGLVKMPSENRKLPDAVIAEFEAWIRMGAPDPREGKAVAKQGIDYAEARKHWAYQPVQPVTLPAVSNSAWPRGDIDRFLLAQIEAKGLKPAADTTRATWLRRVTFDLTGLPPTPEETRDFAKDGSPQATARVVERLLASPRFGEHWARHWLDAVRFDPTIASVDRYRDWVVRAFNADLPYDEFLRYQIAGDLLPPSPDVQVQADRITATQFLALNYREMDPVEGMIEVLGQHVLGVSINCAKCHDHKFDAYSQRDYYALAGVFTSSRVAGNKNVNSDGVELPGQPGTRILALAEATKGVGDTNLLIRGEKSQRGEVIPRRFPIVLAGEEQTPLGLLTRGSGRLELARWTTSPDNPLTARVFANRVWLRLFGRGIVRTPNDFGLGGDPPTNRELLDFLALRFVQSGWSVKKLVREIVLSHAYAQAARNDAAVTVDSDNALFARVPVRRLSYEQIIDNLDAVGGLLSFDIPPRGKNALSMARFMPGRNQPGSDSVAYRALYHNDPVIRQLFDGADPDLITESRDESVTAPQMLFFLNNPQVIAIAGKVAARAKTLAGKPEVGEPIDAAYTILFARRPTASERDAAGNYLTKNSLEKLCHVLLCSSEFTYLE